MDCLARRRQGVGADKDAATTLPLLVTHRMDLPPIETVDSGKGAPGLDNRRFIGMDVQSGEHLRCGPGWSWKVDDGVHPGHEGDDDSGIRRRTAGQLVALGTSEAGVSRRVWGTDLAGDGPKLPHEQQRSYAGKKSAQPPYRSWAIPGAGRGIATG